MSGFQATLHGIHVNKDTIPMLLDTCSAAKLLTLSNRTLEAMRLADTGPPYIKLGKGPRAKVVYHRDDLMAWLDENRKRPGKKLG